MLAKDVLIPFEEKMKRVRVSDSLNVFPEVPRVNPMRIRAMENRTFIRSGRRARSEKLKRPRTFLHEPNRPRISDKGVNFAIETSLVNSLCIDDGSNSIKPVQVQNADNSLIDTIDTYIERDYKIPGWLLAAIGLYLIFQ